MLRFTFVLMIASLCAAPLHAQEKPWWNPFAASDKSGSSAAETRTSSFFDGGQADDGQESTDKPLFSMPTLPKVSFWPGSDDKPEKPATASKKKQPSPLDRIGQTSKQWWGATADFLNPFDDDPKPRRQQGYQPQNERQQKPGFFSWFSQPEEEEITSVVDFIGQPRPRM